MSESLLNETSEGCPLPLLPWEPLTATKYTDWFNAHRFCTKGCCMACNYLSDMYHNVYALSKSDMSIGIASMVVSILLMVSQLLSRRLVVSEFNFMQALALFIATGATTIFGFINEPVFCQDKITPALGKYNPGCMIQNIWYMFGFQLIMLTLVVRILKMYCMVVFSKQIPQRIFMAIIIIISAAFTAASAPFTAYSSGYFCSPSYPQNYYTTLIPSVIYTAISVTLQLLTAFSVIKTLYRVETSLHKAKENSALEDNHKMGFLKRLNIVLYSCWRFLRLSWRSMVFVLFMAIIIIFLSANAFAASRKSKRVDGFNSMTIFLTCMTTSRERNICQEAVRHSLDKSTVLVFGNTLLCSTFVLLFTELRPFFFRGWALLLRNPRLFLSRSQREFELSRLDEKKRASSVQVTHRKWNNLFRRNTANSQLPMALSGLDNSTNIDDFADNITIANEYQDDEGRTIIVNVNQAIHEINRSFHPAAGREFHMDHNPNDENDM
ncbi:hypothetical protein V1511DRAFT_179733 [Dipodascopsis uninucleata]